MLAVYDSLLHALKERSVCLLCLGGGRQNGVLVVFRVGGLEGWGEGGGRGRCWRAETSLLAD
eukprot:2417041-Rhodomonas_salina.1